MNGTQRLVAALVLAASSAGCATAARSPATAAREPKTMVEVMNNNWADMVVYAARSGARYRLGMVTSMKRRSFPLPRSLSLLNGDIELVADPIGSTRGFSTGPIQVMPGQWIEFTIENNLRISNYAVWSR